MNKVKYCGRSVGNPELKWCEHSEIISLASGLEMEMFRRCSKSGKVVAWYNPCDYEEDSE